VEAARLASEADLPELARLCREALRELQGMERGGPLFVAREARPEPVEEGLRAALADPDATVLLGTLDSSAIGYSVGRVETLRGGRALGVIEDLFVEAEARGVGVGEAMMDLLLEWFGSRGCIGVDAMALPGARATKNFFEESGFSARLLVMHHRMGDAT
jgi:GNAT superfamily N-acetyltransferase